jgi:hypothetical protein
MVIPGRLGGTGSVAHLRFHIRERVKLWCLPRGLASLKRTPPRPRPTLFFASSINDEWED